MTLHIPLLCRHGSDLSKLLLAGSQTTGHSFSWPYFFFLLETPVDFFFSPIEFKGTWGSPSPTKAKPPG